MWEGIYDLGRGGKTWGCEFLVSQGARVERGKRGEGA